MSDAVRSKNIAVFGIYPTANAAERAVDHLLAHGFTNSDISVLLPDDESTRAFAHEKHTKAPEGTAVGVSTGGIIGGTLGLLAGIGALAIPGVGPLIAAGPIMGALAGLGVGGAVGGVVGALVGMGIPEYEAQRYEGRVKGGGTLLSVHCDTSDEVSAAKDALKATGAEDIASANEHGSPDGAAVSDRETRDSSDWLDSRALDSTGSMDDEDRYTGANRINEVTRIDDPTRMDEANRTSGTGVLSNRDTLADDVVDDTTTLPNSTRSTY